MEALQGQYGELDEKYRSRESRPEDVMRVKKLTAIIKGMDEELKKTQEELKFFKLELINRETNFNKVFSRNPTVGVLAPGGGAAPAGGGSSSSGLSATMPVAAAPPASAPPPVPSGASLAATTGSSSSGAPRPAAPVLAPYTSSRSLTGAGAAVMSSSTRALPLAMPALPETYPASPALGEWLADDGRGTATPRLPSSGTAAATSRPSSGSDAPSAAVRELVKTPVRAASGTAAAFSSDGGGGGGGLGSAAIGSAATAAGGMPPLPRRPSSNSMQRRAL